MAGWARAIRKASAPAALLMPITLLLGVFFLVPLGIMVVYSFLEAGMYGGVTWTFYPYNYGRILGWPIGGGEEFDPVYLWIFLNSVRFALMTVVVTLLICYPAAFWVAGMPANRKTLILFLITLPFFANLLIRIYAWLLLLRPTGFINTILQALGVIAEPLNMIFTEFAVVVGLVYTLVPFMFLPIYANVERLDGALLQASQDLGATPLQTFRRVILPLTLPGIAGGSIIVFIPALGNFIIPAFLGGSKVQMTGNVIERQFLQARNWPFGASLTMLIMAVVMTLLLIYTVKIMRRGDDRQAAG
ncbi:spermidine/putrescine transport system permease protein [Rhodoligotrophos appendicifer]|uniref:ABC transporter permease n=1 Tax=Rhodoligotrophos appendicifer TaxID=987056 RepID=UPI001185D504|nr:ABC transporter permease [Rhodoligotrophos appendicifer]